MFVCTVFVLIDDDVQSVSVTDRLSLGLQSESSLILNSNFVSQFSPNTRICAFPAIRDD